MSKSPVISRQSSALKPRVYTASRREWSKTIPHYISHSRILSPLLCIYSLPRLRGRVGVGVLILLFMLFASGCIPATVPDNLDDTPGPPVILNNGLYEGLAFTAQVPEGWRVITSEAQAPQAVIFVAPDDKTLIRLILGEVDLETVEVANQRSELYPLTLDNGARVTAVFSSPALSWATYWVQFETVRDSVSSR